MRVIDTLAEFLGLRVNEAEVTESDIMLAEALAARSTAFYVAVSYIANAISQCELCVYRDGKAVKDELYYALNVSPNPNQSGSELLHELIEGYYYNEHALVVQPNSSRNHFYVANGFTRTGRPLGEDRFSGVSIGDDYGNMTLNRTFRASKVFYLKLGNKAVKKELQALNSDMAKVLAIAMNGFQESNRSKYVFYREGRPGGDQKAEQERKDAIVKNLKKFVNNPNAVLPLTTGQKFERVPGMSGGASAKDVIDLRKDIFETTAAAFKIPTSMVYGNITSVDQIIEQFLTFAVDPIAEALSDELTRKCFEFSEWDGGRSFVKVDTTTIKHIDLFSVATGVDKLISSGTLNIDEVRKRLGEPALDTDFSTAHWMTKNYQSSDAALSQIESA